MHGIKRTRMDAAALAAKREKEKEKLKEYLESETRILDMRDAGEWTQEALKLTEQFLTGNPEHATIWNYRREIFQNLIFATNTPEEIYQKLCSDLAFTTTSLKRYPKVYVIWNHRRWCLEHIPDGPDTETDGWKKSTWSQEMMIVEKMLTVDGRNFHAWNYRRYILAHCPPSQKRTDADEITYTTRHIEKNHSNFSSWHQRSLVYTKLWNENPESKKGVLDKEFELVKQALWMVPDDQSGWIYHRWLIGAGEDPKVLEREIEMIEELQQEEPESRWVLNSLVHYKQLLLRHRPDSQLQIIKECKEMLEKLITIDPTRKNRYKDIAGTLS